MKANRKTATGLLLVQWSRFSHINIKLEGSSLITGVNGTGKSTILDAITYLLTGNTQFNIAAKDRDRNIAAYVRGDTKSDGKARYLRDGDVVSYIAMEFFSPEENDYFVTLVCIEMVSEQLRPASWHIARNARLADINFYKVDGNMLSVTPKNLLQVKGKRISSKDFLGRDKGTEQVIRALGLRCSVSKYRSKLVKMMAFDPQKNIDKFIQECVLEPGEMTSLASLREQRANYDAIQEAYNSMCLSKNKLEEIEKQTRIYEQKCDDYNKRKLIFLYQEWKRAKEDIRRIIDKSEIEKAALKTLEQQSEIIKDELSAARERLDKAEHSDTFQGIDEIIKDRERQLDNINNKIKVAEKNYEQLIKLSEKISDALSVLNKYDIDKEKFNVLLNLVDEEMTSNNKREAFIQFAKVVSETIENIRNDEFRLKEQRNLLNEELSELEKQKRQLESNQFVYEKVFLDARGLIQREFKRQGIITDVRFFVELISDIKGSKWRKAIETFLENKRFNIIVDGKYCGKALEIVNANPALKSKVVITDKLPDSEIKKDSAASLLEISNVYARRYANYLLNGIHLCDSIEELHDYPLGGIMTNGMLSKSYAVSKMDMSRTKLFIGQDAIKQQLEETKKEIENKKNNVELLSENIQEKNQQKDKLSFEWKVDNYNFDAPDELNKMKVEQINITAEIEKYKKDPSFMAVLEEREKAKKEVERIEKDKEKLQKEIGGSEEKIRNYESNIEERKISSKNMHQIFEEEAKQLETYRISAIEEYEELRQKQHSVTVITKKTVDSWEKQKNDAAEELEKLHFDYCRISGSDSLFRGVSYINYYRDEYRKLANVKIEEAQIKLEEQSKRLQSAFVGDFVAELDEAIREAKSEIDQINIELRKLPFGADTYKFMMEERPERKLFFDICKRLHNYLDNADYYLNSIKDDEAAERELKDFLDIVLAEEDESEYTDYRKYFTYDMKITSKQGDEIVTANYSNKQGSASNGEKQTPYFIILAASLMQCYDRKRCCARLAFIDEAFSALSKERIEQMVKYLEKNDFQVLYAAPPEKINSIGRYIQSTIGLIPKGRYTYAIEGLVEASEIEGE